MLRERARAALPAVQGELRLAGLREPVQVLWDRWGVPHVYAQGTHDLFFTQGYILASERLFQLEVMLRFGSGRLSEIFGDLSLPLDRFIRAVGWNRAARRLCAQWDDLSWEMSEAFAAGVRAWLSHMPAKPVEYEILQLDPYFPDGWEAMTTLFPELGPEPGAVVAGKGGGPANRRSALDLLREAPRFPKGQGSNNWVVAGRRSATGRPLLANDPHLFAQLPSISYEIHLSAPGIDVRGVALPFSP